MKAIMVAQTGGPDVLRYGDVEAPRIEAGKLLVRIQAAGVNFIDVYRRNGRYPVALPSIPGLEGTGIVEKLGNNANGFKVGQRVSYTGVPGAYAQFALVPVSQAIAVPDELSVEQAAAFPLQGMTAHYLVHEFRHVKRGDDVLVHAAAGGMGLVLTQWLKRLGARVIGTTSTEEKAEAARQAGADEVILYTRQDFAQEVKRLTSNKGVELIIDGVGKSTFPGDLEAIAVRGNIVIFGAAGGVADPIAPNNLQLKSITISGGSLFNYLLTREELMRRATDVLEGIRNGWLKLKIGHVFPLERAAEAHKLLEGRASSGKIILKVA